MVGHGHVAPCARCCAGSRRPDHARRPFLVRSRRQAHAHPRRAILSSAGPLCVACTPAQPQSYLASHNLQHMGGKEGVQERGRHRQHPSRKVRGTSASRANANCGWEPTAQQATASPLPAFMLPACCHCLALPAMRRTPPRCSLLCRGRAPLLRSMRDAAKSQCPPGPPGRPRLRCMCVCV